MAVSDSLPQINLGVQGWNPGGSHNFVCLCYLPRPEGQNLNLIKLQPWRNGQKVDKSQMNDLDITVIMSRMKVTMRRKGKRSQKTPAPAPWVKSKREPSV
ncbi:hypothetical protein TNCV_443001 [Trichonephila clavipes]|nr:hypothetical protein TNCV_443001 [Trichonephila clavipes]